MLVQKSKPNCSQGRVYSFVTAFHVPGTSVSFLGGSSRARQCERRTLNPTIRKNKHLDLNSLFMIKPPNPNVLSGGLIGLIMSLCPVSSRAQHER